MLVQVQVLSPALFIAKGASALFSFLLSPPWHLRELTLGKDPAQSSPNLLFVPCNPEIRGFVWSASASGGTTPWAAGRGRPHNRYSLPLASFGRRTPRLARLRSVPEPRPH